jgi:hypothetical protein
MMVELMRDISHGNRRWMELKMDEPKDTLAGASYRVKTSSRHQGVSDGTLGQGARFPWIQMRDPFDFHSW